MKLSKVISNSAAAGLLDVTTRLLPMVTFPWVVRTLGPSVYGDVGFALSISTLFGLLASPGFTTFGTREVARNPGRSAEIAGEILGARMAFAAVSYLLLVVFAFTVGPANPQTRLLILLTGLSFLVSAADFQWIFLGRNNMWIVSASGMIGQIFYAIVIVALVRAPADNWIIPSAAAASSLIASCYLLVMGSKEFGIPRPVFAPSRWFRFLPVCLTLGLASIMSFLYDQIDTVMLRYLRSEHELGLYVASYRIMGISMSFLPILGRVFFPLLSNAAEDSVDLQKRYLNWMGIGTVGLAVPVAVGGFLLASPLTDLVLGSSYKGAETLVRWLMFNLIAGPMASLFSAQLIPHSREGRYIASVGSGAALNVVLNLIFIPEYGARAAVWTTILSQFLVAGMGFYFSRDLARPNLKRPLAASVLASSVMSCVVLALLHWFNPHVLILVAVGGSVYGAIFYFCISRFRLAPEMSAKN